MRLPAPLGAPADVSPRMCDPEGDAGRVAEGDGAGDVGADVVALKKVVRTKEVAANRDRIAAAAGDHVAHRGRRAAEGVVVRCDDGHIVIRLGTPQQGGADGIRADQITLKEVISAAVGADLDVNEIAGRPCTRRPAYRRPYCATPGAKCRSCSPPLRHGRVGADQISLDHVVVGIAAAGQKDSRRGRSWK